MKLLFIVSLSFGRYIACSPPEYFNVGLMFPIATDDFEVSSGVKYIAAMEMAIDEINDKTDGVNDELLPHTELRMVVRSPRSAFEIGAEAAGEMVSIDDGKGVIGCVGPAELRPMKGSNPVFQEAGNVPQIGYNIRNSMLGDSRTYPNHLRTIPAIFDDGPVIAELLVDFFAWDKVTLFYTTGDYGSISSFLFKEEADKRGIEILSSHSFLVGAEDLTNAIKSAKKAGAYIFVFLMDASDGHNLMKQGYEQGLFNKKTQIIGGDNLSTPGGYAAAGLNDHKMSELMPGYIGVRWKEDNVFPSPQLSSFVERWKSRTNTDGSSGACDTRMDYYNDFYLHQFQPFQNESAPYTCAGVNFSSYSDDGSDLGDVLFAYDAVMSLAMALDHIAYGDGVCDPTPSHVHDVLLNDVYFQGLSGNVSFSKKYEEQNIDVGGRGTSYVYEVVNYVPGGDSSGNLQFKTAVQWHSEFGFEKCKGLVKYQSECYDIEFSTKNGEKPYDSPPAEIIEMPTFLSAVLILFAASALALVVTLLTPILVFRKRRICKMAQPMLIALICLGSLLMCIRVILAAIPLSRSSCTAEFWTGHLGFIIVIAALGVKTWRVYMVTSAMKKVKISEMKCVAIVGVIILVSSIPLLVFSFIGNIHVVEVTLVKDQFEYHKELKCLAENKETAYVVSAIEIVVVLFTGRMLWLTRKVASTISSTAVSATAVTNVAIAVVSMYIILELVKFEPNIRQFFVALVIAMLTIRVTWILYSQLAIDVLLGYDLDKALQKKKLAWSITNIGIFKRAAKVFGAEESTVNSPTGTRTENSCDAGLYEKAMAKFSKSKNAGELQQEIEKIKREITERQTELACLENMKFASEHSSGSSSSARASQVEEMKKGSDGSYH